MAKRRFGLGLLLGAAAGVVAGLLTAPKSGKETREELKRKAGDLKTDAARKSEEARGKAEEVTQQAKDKAEELRTRAENAVEGAKAGFNKPTHKNKNKR